MASVKIPVYDLKGGSKSAVTVARAFSEPVRTDLIQKAVTAERASARQPYGADPLAGKRTSAHYHGRRHRRYSMMNRETSRMKRIHNQGFLNMTARFIPGVTKGHKAHPPKAEKSWSKKINKKERMKAILSAISASADREMLAARGHTLNGVKHVPLVVEDAIEGVKKAKEVSDALSALGLKEELRRLEEKKQRAGKGKMRGRRCRRKVGPLLVMKEDKGLARASMNVQGVESSTLSGLSAEMLAPGGHPGRLVIWSKSALEEFEKSLK